jgi:hypothetical protein
LALTGVLAAPLRAQVVPATAAPATGALQPGVAQQPGIAQPVSDLVPVILMFTGAGEWDIVGGIGGSFGPGPSLGLGGSLALPSALSGPGAQGFTMAGSATPQVAILNPQSAIRVPQSPSPPARQVANAGPAAAAPTVMPTRAPVPVASSAPPRAVPGTVPAGGIPQSVAGNPRAARRMPPARPPDFLPVLY